MTKEDKELLIQDLCARLPYGFIIYRPSDNANLKISDIDDFAHFLEYSDREEFKPYLRPMSSMMEEERTEYFLLKHKDNDRDDNIILLDEASTLIDWLNAHHFDYRGLIPRGLALEAPENIYVL